MLPGKAARAGALAGVSAWLVYGLVECWFTALLPWLIHRDGYLEPNWAFAAVSMVVYTAVGGLFGAVAGLVLRRAEGGPRVLELAAAGSIVVAYIGNYLANIPLDVRTSPPLLLAIFLLTVMVASAVWPQQSRLVAFAANAWTAPVLLLGTPWLTRDAMHWARQTSKIIAALSYAVAVLALALWISGKDAAGKRRLSLKYVIGLALITLALSGFPRQSLIRDSSVKSSAQGSAGRPNIVLITMDTVRADHLSLYGYRRDTSPNLQAFAREATVYRRMVATSDLTLSTHASLFTGLFAKTHGAHRSPPDFSLGRPLAEQFPTLAGILAAHGYATKAVVANTGYLSTNFQLNRGFQVYDQRRPPSRFLGACPPFTIRERIRKWLAPPAPTAVYRSAEEINEGAFDALQQTDRSRQPFFLFVNYMDAHWPYTPPTGFNDRYPGRDKSFDVRAMTAARDAVLIRKETLPEKVTAHLTSQYDGGIAYIDSAIGKLIEYLKKVGAYDNTMIIVTADHGEAFGEHALLEHGYSVYQDQVHVPLIIKYARSGKGEESEEWVSSADIMPTVLQVAGLLPVPGLDGRALLAEAPKSRLVVSESFPISHFDGRTSRFRRKETAIFSNDYKLILSTTGRSELFNLRSDPSENEDLGARETQLKQQLASQAADWLRVIPGQFNSPKLSKDALERLKSLGYVQ